MERAVQDQLIRNGAGSRHPGKYEPSILTLGLEQWRWVGVGLEKRLDSGQVRAHPCLSSERELHIHPNSQRCRLLPSLAALRRRRRCHPHPRTEFHIRIAVQKKKEFRLRCRRRMRIRGRLCAFKVVGYASRRWMGKSIEHLVVGVGVPIA